MQKLGFKAGLPITRPNFSMTKKKLARSYRNNALIPANSDFYILFLGRYAEVGVKGGTAGNSPYF
jgi:hypothetical protein